MVVDINLPYNVIFGRPFLNRFGAIILQKYLKLKFPSWDGVVVVRGGQKLAAECYVIMTQGACDRYVCVATDPFEQREERRAQPVEKMVPVPLNDILEASFLVSENLSSEESSQLARLLNKYKGEFAWVPADMHGIVREVAEHHLHVNPNIPPIQQKTTSFL